jgi:undecaprenyl-diphosphatase
MSAQSLFVRVDQVERRLCLVANVAARWRVVRPLFRTVSRLGDGVFWYAVIALMPVLLGAKGFAVAAQMLATGALGLLVYKFLKQRLVRERPFIGLAGIQCAMPPLDRYSFPSGHTLHAVSFTIIAVHHVPEFAIVLLPFTVLVGMSRVVLGLHYPTDVIVGAAIGAGLAFGSNSLIG